MIEGRNSSHDAPTVAKCDRILMKHQRVLHVSLALGLRQQKFEEKKKEWVGVEEMIKGKLSTVNGTTPQQAPPPLPPREEAAERATGADVSH